MAGEARATERAYIWSVWWPLASLCMGLRGVRAVKRGEVAGVLGALDLVRSDLAIMGALLLGGLGLLVALRGHRRARILALASMQLIALVWAVAELAATNFFLVSGSCLDFALIRYALSPENDLWSMVRASTPRGFFVAGGVGALWLLGMPWAARWWMMRGEAKGSARGFPRWMWAVVAGLLGLSVLGPMREPSVPFASNAVVHIARTGVEMAGEASAASVEFGTLDAELRAAPGKKAKNVVVIMLESTRASATSLHNPALDTTPFLKSLAKNSIWAERAYSVVPHTSKAIVSVHCGVEPNLTLPVTEASSSGLPAKCLARLLREQGYHTAFYQTATTSFEGRPQLISNLGFETFVGGEGLPSAGFEKANYFGVEDDAMLAPSRRWIEGHRDKPFLLTYLTVTPHHNYLAPKRYGHEKRADDVLLNRYLNSVNYVDHFVENVVSQLKALGVWEDTILVVVGDHGEGFGEHGRKQHDSVLYEEGLHVPLVIHDPSDPRERKIAPLVSQLDILPTVLSLAGWSLDAPLRGQDMRTLEQDRRLFGYCWYDRSCISMLDGTLKVIHHFGRRPDEAFELSSDPEERENIAARVRDLSSRVRAMLAWRGGVRGAYSDYYEELLSEVVSSVMHEGITHPLRFEMGDYLEFLGYDLSWDGPVRARSEVTITFYYRVLRRIPAAWRLSTQGLTDRGDWVSLDHEPVEGLYPMSQWQPGQYIKDVYKTRLSSKLQPGGSLKVVQGLYRSRSGKKGTEHAPISGQQADDKQKVELFTLEIKPLGQP